MVTIQKEDILPRGGYLTFIEFLIFSVLYLPLSSGIAWLLGFFVGGSYWTLWSSVYFAPICLLFIFRVLMPYNRDADLAQAYQEKYKKQTTEKNPK